MKKALVTVVIPFYENNKFLLNALNSVLNQKYKNYEIIIINDNNTKKNINFLKKIKKKIQKNKNYL
tara:strand:- start:535 stop:732 length:198 start_codon:yes stop_codon:yes gene_type:complete